MDKFESDQGKVAIINILSCSKGDCASEEEIDEWIKEYIEQAKNETQDVMHAIKNLRNFSLTKKL